MVAFLEFEKPIAELESKIEELRKMSESERYQFIQEMMECGDAKCFAVGLWLAKSCLQERASFEGFLEGGLSRGDASTVKYWIRAVIHSLGFRRVARLVSKRVESDPESVIKAEYWLRQLCPRDNLKALEAIAVLQNEVRDIVERDPGIIDRVLSGGSL